MDNHTIRTLPPLEPRRIGRVNIIGLKTLIEKEVGRFLNVYLQTIIAPVVTTLLYYAIFALAFGGIAKMVGDVPYLTFLAPGLVMMTMVQNAFANTSSSMVISKVQGNIVDVLMPPLSPMEIFGGYMIGAVLRGLTVGVCCTAAIWATADLTLYAPWAVFAYAVLGNMMLACLGLAAGLWSEKFDHIAAVTNFVVMPLTFLSGTFYSVTHLPAFWQNLIHYNPFFYMIDGFRYGLSGHAEGDSMIGLVTLVLMNVMLCAFTLRLLQTGYKIKS